MGQLNGGDQISGKIPKSLHLPQHLRSRKSLEDKFFWTKKHKTSPLKPKSRLTRNGNLREDIRAINQAYLDRKEQSRSRTPPSRHGDELLSDAPEGVIIGEVRKQSGWAPIFELPEVVLDLDAEDSPCTRPFDKQVDGLEQRLKWAADPLLEELRMQVPLHQREFKAEAEAMSLAARRPLGPEAITDYDIFATALLDADDSVEQGQPDLSTDQSRLYTKLRAHGVPQSIIDRGRSEIIPFMLHRQRLAAQNLDEHSPLIVKAGACDWKVMSFQEELAQCRSLTDLRKVVPRIFSPSSAKHVGDNAVTQVYTRLTQLYPTEDLEKSVHQPVADPELLEFLKFVNNFTIHQLEHNKHVHAGMAWFGLKLSSRHGVLPSILQYLDMCLSEDVIGRGNIKNARKRWATLIARNILSTLQKTDEVAVGTKARLQQLLFVGNPRGSTLLGWEPDSEWHQFCLELKDQVEALHEAELLMDEGQGSKEQTPSPDWD